MGDHDELPFVGNVNQDEFVYPWTVIIKKPCTSDLGNDRNYVEECGMGLHSKLVLGHGFTHIKVHPLWNQQDHSLSFFVRFKKDLSGFHYATSLAKSFELNGRGKKDWFGEGEKTSRLYGWMAVEDDYMTEGVIGEYLHQLGKLQTVAGILYEEVMEKNRILKKIECMYNETSLRFSNQMDKNDRLERKHSDELREMQQEHDEMKSALDTQRKELEFCRSELEKHKAEIEAAKK
ncbi:hypothetical protein C5167_002333 [Papaver somniferum]|uniref:XS domain-containing protein n=1 Tax=Papaver somniferum TaxID=3469 RepID=A0A4Y7KUM7_PAPSO|nr:protein INVOLVED IN DE NOVO 2-like [Papaver somniferum]RZC75821.1 hypothetical protein C5167_002333 [Papaver somniferum]